MPTITLSQGLDRYYQANPGFTQGKNMQIGWIHVPWEDLQRHDIMHVVTGYSTALDQELQLLGFLLTAITLRRPWYYYLQSFGVFLELLLQSLRGQAWGGKYHSPWQVCQLYRQGVAQGLRVQPKIKASLSPQTVLDRSLESLRQEYNIVNAGAWD
jgi:ubiquinone biosynthesis protein Coq4